MPLAYWVFHTLGKNITPTVETREEHELVTGGPYRWVRHPLHTVGSSFFASLSLVAANWFMGLASVVVLVMLLVRLPKEEERLIERRRIPRLHEANRTAAAAHQAKRRVAPPSSPLVSGARVLRGCKPPFRFLRREEESRPLY